MRYTAAILLCWFVAGTVAGQSLADLGATEMALAPSPVSKVGEPAWISDAIPMEATGLVVSGISSDRTLVGWARFEDGPWLPLTIVFSATEDIFFAGFHGETVYGDGRFRIRFETPHPLRITSSGIFDNRKDGKEAGAHPEEHEDTLDGSRDLVHPPYMHDRAAWGANPFRGQPIPLARPRYQHMAFHHAAGFWAHTKEEGLLQLKAIQDLHQNIRGWSDIGYHFVLDQSGRLYQGRPFLNGNVPLHSVPTLALGAHVGGHNTGNIGVCMLGCYHPPWIPTCTDMLSEPALDSLAVTFAFLAERYGVSPDALRGHRQFEQASTSCPGSNNMAILEELRERIRTYLVTGNQALGSAQVSARIDVDGVVHLSWEFPEDRGIASYRIERVEGSQITVVFQGSGAEAGRSTDPGVMRPGAVTYRLYARSANGREQLLAEIEVSIGSLRQHVLTENFPNPFQQSTTIRYYLPQDGIVHLDVFDLLGREVRQLVHEAADGKRWYHTTLDANDLPAGIYFYRLRVEDFARIVYEEVHSLVRIQ